MSSKYNIRVFGDPVLRNVAKEVADIDAKLVSVAHAMLDTMYEEPGIGLAAPQVGIQKRFFVYDFGDGPDALFNPVIEETSGECIFEEGCLSVPGLHWDIVRPSEVLITGWNLKGEQVSIEADDLAARVFQHEFDHLDGILLIDRLDDETRKVALKILSDRLLDLDGNSGQDGPSERQVSSESDDKNPGLAKRIRSRAAGLTLP